jgi:anti-anti-sigma factor
MFGVLIFDTLPGLFIGIGVALVLLLYRASRPHVAVLGKVPGSAGQYADVERHDENQQQPGVKVLRIEGGLFFANADTVRAVVRQHAAAKGTTAIVLDGETMPYVDVTAAKMLVELSEDLERDGVRLYVAREIGQVRDVLRSADDAKHLARVFPTVDEAVQAALVEGTSSTPESAKSSETSS